MRKTLSILVRSGMMLFVALFMLRCSDDKNDEKKPASELIIGTWQVTADVISPPLDLGSGPVSDLYALTEACDRDDVYIIKNGGAGEFNEGGSKCDPADPQSEDFNWTLTNNNSTLTISGGGSSAIFSVVQLNETTLKLSVTESILGTNYTETITYVRK